MAIIIDTEDQPRYVSEQDYYAPTAREWVQGTCTHERTHSEQYPLSARYSMTVTVCDSECGSVL